MPTTLSVLIPHSDPHRRYLEGVYQAHLAELFTVVRRAGWDVEACVEETPGRDVAKLRCDLLAMAKGTYAMWLDADDAVSPDYVVAALELARDEGAIVSPGTFFRSWVGPDRWDRTGHVAAVSWPVMTGTLFELAHCPPYPDRGTRGKTDAHPTWADRVKRSGRWRTLPGLTVCPVTGPLYGPQSGRGTNTSGTARGDLGSRGQRLEEGPLRDWAERHLERLRAAMEAAREAGP